MSRTSVPTLYLCGGRQTIGGDRTSLPSARRGKRDHERSWVKRVFISSLHTSRSKVHEEGHPSCQARTGKNSCVHTALFSAHERSPPIRKDLAGAPTNHIRETNLSLRRNFI